MRASSWSFLVLFVPGLLAAEVTFEIDPLAFPMNWQSDALPQVDAVVLDHATNLNHHLTAAVYGPMGPQSRYFAVFQSDQIISSVGSFLNLRLTIGCGDLEREYTNYYDPFMMFYFVGLGDPIVVEFPINPLELCPSYSLGVEVFVFEGHSYSLFHNHDQCTWNEAKRIAHELESEVASISDASENEFIRSLVQDLPAWIGLTYDVNEAAWIWSDGSVVSYSNWADGYPVNPDSTANFVLMGADGTWTNTDSLGFQNPAHVLLEWPFEWPIEIDDLSVSYQGQYFILDWSVPSYTDSSQVFGVHFSRSPYFEPSVETRLGETTGAEFAVPVALVSGSQGWFRIVPESAE